MQFGTTERNAICDAFETSVGTAPKMRFLTGSMPATPATAETGTLISQLTLPSDWLNAASGGAKTKNGTWSGTAAATGVIGYCRIKDSAGTTVRWQGTVTQAITLTTSASTAANGNVLTFTSTTGVSATQAVRGTGIETGTTVLAVTSTTVTLSLASLAGVASGASITFGDTSGDMTINTTTVSAIGQAITVDTWTLTAGGA